MNSKVNAQGDTSIETRLKNLLPDPNGGIYVGQRMVKLSVDEVEEVIETIKELRTRLGESGDAGMSER